MNMKKYEYEIKSYSARQILNSKTPMDFIHRCIYTDISYADKHKVSSEWREKTGYDVGDIQYARNRHPYWKAKKLKGNDLRTKLRQEKHNYYDEFVRTSKTRWSDEGLKEFIKENIKEKDVYVKKDWELAEWFSVSIPSIQYLRRKHNWCINILQIENTRVTKKRILNLMKTSEKLLMEHSQFLSRLLKK